MKLQLELNSNKTNYLHPKHDFSDKAKNSLNGEYKPLYNYSEMDKSLNKNNAKAVFKGLKHGYKQEGNINNSINTTTRESFGGRISFKGANPAAAKTFAEKVVTNKAFAAFCKMAENNPAVAEAVGALFITCGIRPLSIMAMPKKDVDKNRKAASHSIASGIVGVVFAQILYSPFSKAMGKIRSSIEAGNAGKYLKGAADYLTKPGKKKIVKGLETEFSNIDCFKQLVTYGPKLFTASILAAMTVGMMPYIDKYIIDKYIFKPSKNADDKPILTTYDHFKYLAFRSTPKENAVFQNFRGVLK